MTRWRTRHRGTRSDRGAAAVEFAIVVVVLLLIIFAIIDFGRLLYVQQAMKSASREGARAAVVATGTPGTVWQKSTDAGNAAAALAGDKNGLGVFVNGSTTSLTGTPAGVHTDVCSSPGAAVKVAVVSDFTWFTPIGTFSNALKQVVGETTMRCE